jgi:endonuclease YncB( thermonuclease family)
MALWYSAFPTEAVDPPPSRPHKLMMTRLFMMFLVSLFWIPALAGSHASVTAVIDGDSLVANIDGHLAVVRLIGVDAPELLDSRGAAQQDGTAAATVLRHLIQGRPILLESDPAVPKTDPHGRMLAYIYRAADGALLNKQMICDGYAKLYRSQPFGFFEEFAQCEAQATALRKGLWGGNGLASEWESRFPGVKYLGEANPGARPPAAASRPRDGGRTPAPRRTRRRPR